MRRQRLYRALTTLGLIVIAAAAGRLVQAGPLDPPAGPVSPTYKTLAEIEPRIAVGPATTPGDGDSLYKITQPGSYYLTGNVTGVAGKHGIEITAGGVTLDLAGFNIVGVAGMGAFDGVSVTVDSLRGIAVTNGSVMNWGDKGVDLGFVSFGCRVEGIRATGNAAEGINAGVSAVVENCTAAFNGQSGIRTNNGSTISGCSAYSNAGSGIQVNNGCSVSNCSTYLNTVNGVTGGTGCTVLGSSAFTNTTSGIQLGDTAAISGCTTLSNASSGIRVNNSATITGCTSDFNQAIGIFAANASTVAACSASSNQVAGIATGSGCTVRDSTCRTNGQYGISAGFGNTVTGCTASANDVAGISLGGGSVAANCTADGNIVDGILCSANCVVRDNVCHANASGPPDGAGISVFGSGSRIEGNTCSASDRGILVNSGGNLIIRNNCDGNVLDWVIAAGNAVGPILDRRVPGGGAISGFSAPTTLNTTDPHANFSH